MHISRRSYIFPPFSVHTSAGKSGAESLPAASHWTSTLQVSFWSTDQFNQQSSQPSSGFLHRSLLCLGHGIQSWRFSPVMPKAEDCESLRNRNTWLACLFPARRMFVWMHTMRENSGDGIESKQPSTIIQSCLLWIWSLHRLAVTFANNLLEVDRFGALISGFWLCGILLCSYV